MASHTSSKPHGGFARPLTFCITLATRWPGAGCFSFPPDFQCLRTLVSFPLTPPDPSPNRQHINPNLTPGFSPSPFAFSVASSPGAMSGYKNQSLPPPITDVPFFIRAPPPTSPLVQSVSTNISSSGMFLFIGQVIPLLNSSRSLPQAITRVAHPRDFLIFNV